MPKKTKPPYKDDIVLEPTNQNPLNEKNSKKSLYGENVLDYRDISDKETFAEYLIENDPVIETNFNGDKSRLRNIIYEVINEFDRDIDPISLHSWIKNKYSDIEDQLAGSLLRILEDSDLLRTQKPGEKREDNNWNTFNLPHSGINA